MSIIDVVKQKLTKTASVKPATITSPIFSLDELRPVDSYISTGLQSLARVPYYPLSLETIYDLYNNSDILRMVITKLIDETFRNGLWVKPAYKMKCTKCKTEFDETVRECLVCGSTSFVKPDYSEKVKIEKWMKNVNMNEQSLIEVLRDIDFDLNLFDNAYILVRKEYTYDEDGYIVKAKPIELLRASPIIMRLVMNSEGRYGRDDNGNVVAFCPEHREHAELVDVEEYAKEPPKCKYCGKRLVPAYFMADRGGKRIYYAKGEVLHVKKFEHGIGYGYPPAFCYDEDTEILTKRGWIKFSELTEEDEVFSMVDGIVKFRKPKEYFKMKYTGKMVKIQNGKVDLMVTPNHKMIIRKPNGEFEVVKAIDLVGKEFYLPYDAMHDGNVDRVIIERKYMYKHVINGRDADGNLVFADKLVDKGDLVFDAEDFAELVAWYLSEGSTNPSKGTFVIAQDAVANANKVERITALLDKYDISYVVRSDRIVIYDKALAVWMLENCGKAKDKHIPDIIFDMPVVAKRRFIEVYILGDGNKGNYKIGRIYTRVKRLADDIHRLAIEAGYGAKMSFYKSNEIYAIHIFDNKNKAYHIYKDNVSLVDYEGYIYDVRVADETKAMYDGWVYVRRNGKSVWSGNTLWVKLHILIKMDMFILWAYNLQRSPYALLFVRGREEDIARAWKAAKEEARNNPYSIVPIAVPDTLGDKKFVEYIDLSYKADDIDFIQFRNEIRKTIGAFFGVSPIFQADTSVGAGLSNEGLQLTVTNRAVEVEQSIFNEKILPWIMKQCGWQDWVVQLVHAEEKDLMARYERELTRIKIAKELATMGYKPILVERDDGIAFEYEYVGEPIIYEQPYVSRAKPRVKEMGERYEGEPEHGRVASSDDMFEGEPEKPRKKRVDAEEV